MSNHESLKKTLQKKKLIKERPFIDKNLQIQIPESDQLRSSEYKSILGSIVNKQEMQNELTQLEVNLQAAIDETKQAHEAWKKLQSKLFKLTEEFKK